MSTKAQRKCLGTLRGLLRHVNTSVDNKVGYPLRADVTAWREHILGEYRANAGVKDKATVRQMRAMAAEVLAGFEAVKQQQGLFFRYGGVDQDSVEYRTAAAHRVGLEIPDKVPVKEFDKSKYNLAAAMSFADTSLRHVNAKFSSRREDAEALGADAAASVQEGKERA